MTRYKNGHYDNNVLTLIAKFSCPVIVNQLHVKHPEIFHKWCLLFHATEIIFSYV